MIPEERLVADDEIGARSLGYTNRIGGGPEAADDACALLFEVLSPIRHLVACRRIVDGCTCPGIDTLAELLHVPDSIGNLHLRPLRRERPHTLGKLLYRLGDSVICTGTDMPLRSSRRIGSRIRDGNRVLGDVEHC